jgi:hypothetical protein
MVMVILWESTDIWEVKCNNIYYPILVVTFIELKTQDEITENIFWAGCIDQTVKGITVLEIQNYQKILKL